MAPLRFRRLVSFSSEERDRPATGLLSSRKWCCQDPGEPTAWAILELEGLAKISAIDIGNFGSAFVEVQVSRSGSSDFRPLLPSSAFLSPVESRSMEQAERVRMFSDDKFDPINSKDSWDTLKVICTQPFNKRVRYGLNFLTVNGVLDSKAHLTSPPNVKKIGSIVMKDEDTDSFKNGSLFSQRRSKTAQKDEYINTSLSEDMNSKQSLASLSLAISQRKEKEKNEQMSKRRIAEENEERRKARKRKLEAINKLPSRKEDDDDNENSSNSNGSIKHEETSSVSKKQPSNEKSAPFKKLFSGVVFTLSGFQNPLRSEIRSKALAMGAAYAGDWNSTCTHLVCAFTNTPKFNQVKSLKGKIVKKEWIEDGNRDRKRYHWRKYALDPKDETGTHSDDEIVDETLLKSNNSPNESSIKSEPEDLCDTDEEIENIRQCQNNKAKLAKDEPQSDAYNQETDKEMSDYGSAEEDYNADTDVESDFVQKNLDFPELPNYFDDFGFYFYGPISNETLIKRIIIRAGGSVYPYMDPGVKMVISEKPWDDNFDQAVKVNPKMRFVVPEYIIKCCEANDKLPTKHFRTLEPTE